MEYHCYRTENYLINWRRDSEWPFIGGPGGGTKTRLIGEKQNDPSATEDEILVKQSNKVPE